MPLGAPTGTRSKGTSPGRSPASEPWALKPPPTVNCTQFVAGRGAQAPGSMGREASCSQALTPAGRLVSGELAGPELLAVRRTWQVEPVPRQFCPGVGVGVMVGVVVGSGVCVGEGVKVGVTVGVSVAVGRGVGV